MTTKTSTTAPKTKRTTKATQKKTTVKVSNPVPSESIEKVSTDFSAPAHWCKRRAVIYPKTVQLTSDEPGKSFFWEEYSPRCAAITAKDFETVYYFAFLTEQAAIDFVKAITTKYCKECLLRSSKRFNSDEFPYEVKVWGMPERTFFGLVKRDLARQ